MLFWDNTLPYNNVGSPLQWLDALIQIIYSMHIAQYVHNHHPNIDGQTSSIYKGTNANESFGILELLQ